MTNKPTTKRVRLRPVIEDSTWFYQVCPPAQAEYIGVRKGIVSYTRELRNGLLIDLDIKGNILGVEILSSKKNPTYSLKK